MLRGVEKGKMRARNNSGSQSLSLLSWINACPSCSIHPQRWKHCTLLRRFISSLFQCPYSPSAFPRSRLMAGAQFEPPASSFISHGRAFPVVLRSFPPLLFRVKAAAPFCLSLPVSGCRAAVHPVFLERQGLCVRVSPALLRSCPPAPKAGLQPKPALLHSPCLAAPPHPPAASFPQHRLLIDSCAGSEPLNTPGFLQSFFSAGRFLPCSSSGLCAELCSYPQTIAPCLERFSSLVLPFSLLQQISSPFHPSFQCKFNVCSINQAINLKLFNDTRYKADCYGDSPEISFQ